MRAIELVRLVQIRLVVCEKLLKEVEKAQAPLVVLLNTIFQNPIEDLHNVSIVRSKRSEVVSSSSFRLFQLLLLFLFLLTLLASCFFLLPS